MKMTIREATIEDLPSIQQLNHAIMVKNVEYDPQIIPNFDLSNTGKRFFREAVESEKGIFLIALDGDKMVGYINGNPKEIVYRKGKYFEIENLGVIPEYKGNGIGGQLLEALIAEIKKMGFERVYLNCYIRNTEALEFYRKKGFEEIDISFEKKIK